MPFPTTNQSPYGPALKQYIDEQVALAVAAADAAMAVAQDALGAESLIVVDGGEVGLPEGASEGTITSYLVKSTTTFSDENGESALPSGYYTFVRTETGWEYFVASGSPLGSGGGEPGGEPPSQPGVVTVTPTSDGFNLSWVASTDASGYEVQIDGGSWVDSGAGTTHNYMGLASGSQHSGAVRAYNVDGQRSASRTWGPAGVISAGLHSQLLGYSPELYLRMSQGSQEVFDAAPGGPYIQIGGGAITYDGPPLVPAATGSALFSGGNVQLVREGFGADLGTTDTMTIVVVGKWPDATSEGVVDLVRLSTETEANPFNAKVTAAVEGGPYGFEMTSIGGEHTFAWRKTSANSNFEIFRDGTFLTNGGTWGDTDPITRFYIRRSNTSFIISHLMITSEALSDAEILAIAQGADTVGNPR